jgi:hypothetical protein
MVTPKINKMAANTIIKEEPDASTFMAIRRTIGYLGASFPVILCMGTYVFTNCNGIEPSVSAYYYTIMGDVFVGLLVAVGLFLFRYTGYDKTDRWLTNIAGLAAIMVALFPTNNQGIECFVIHLPLDDVRKTIHYVSAAVFFILLGIMSLVQFPKTSSTGLTAKAKRNRNMVYRVCGIIVLLCVVLIFIFSKTKTWATSTFWLEWVALLAFGTSWLTKGQALKFIKQLRDEETLKQASLKTTQN